MVATNNEYPNFSDMELNELESIGQLENPLCRELYRYWSGLRSDETLLNFDLIEIPEVIPFIVLLQRTADGQSFRFKMIGQFIVKASTIDLTGKTLSIGDEVAPLTAIICQWILKRQSPVYTSDHFLIETPGRMIRFEETVGLPLFDAEGDLTQIVLAHGPK